MNFAKVFAEVFPSLLQGLTVTILKIFQFKIVGACGGTKVMKKCTKILSVIFVLTLCVMSLAQAGKV